MRWFVLLSCGLALAGTQAFGKQATAEGAAVRPQLPLAAPASEGFSPRRLQRLERFLRKATDQQGYLGGVVLIARDGHIVDWRAYGHRDIVRRETLPRDAIFRIYSMTKTVTSVAVLQLAEAGKLEVDDPVARYLPELSKPQVMIGGTADAPKLAPARSQITIRELLTHTAGFPAGLGGDEEAVKALERIDPHGAKDLHGFVERLSRAPLAAQPGTRFGYDGAALEVLARLVEVVSKEPFDIYLRKHILDPLRMRDTGFNVPAEKRKRVIDLTTMGRDGRLVLDTGPSAVEPGAPLNAYPSGAGGLYSTAADYARFCQMLLDGGTLDDVRILKRETVASMLRNQLTMLDPPVTQFSAGEGFGFGGYVVTDPGKREQGGALGQFGWSGAASTTYMINPREHLVAILMLQHLPREGVHDLPRISRDFYRLVYESLER